MLRGRSLAVAAVEQFEGRLACALRAPTRPWTPIRRRPAIATTRPWSMGGTLLTVGHADRAVAAAPIPRTSEPPGLGGPGEDASTASRIQLRWRWAPEATATRLLARQGSPPTGPSDPDAIVTTVTRDDYDRLGSWTTQPSPHVIAEIQAMSSFNLRAIRQTVRSTCDRTTGTSRAFSLAEFDGASLVSRRAGAECHDRGSGPASADHRVLFLEAPVAAGSSLAADLRTEPPGAAIPQMVLVANRAGRSALGRGR